MNELGVDEAGRGPVIGPLVMAGVILTEDNRSSLDSIGMKDSKKVLPSKREKLFEIIKQSARHKIIIVDAKEIDAALNNDELNLNKLEAIKSAELINSLRPDKAILDSPSNNSIKYEQEVRKHIGDSLTVKIVAENKADENYLSSAAASILAKVTRDREIARLKEEYGVDFGSGYPSDPSTKAFLEKNWNNPKFRPLFRETWASFKKLKNSKDQKKLGEY